MAQSGKQPYIISRATASITLLSVLSPLSGLLLEMALAWRYGASDTVDAFRVSSLLAGFGIQLFFGYLLPHVVVPMFSEYRAKGEEQEAWRLVFSLAAVLSVLTLLFIGWVWFDPGVLAELLGPGLTTSGHEQVMLLLRSFSLALLLMAWSGVVSGILYVQRIFWLSALAQIVPNSCVVLAVAIDGSTAALAWGVVLGYAAMLGMFVWGLLHVGRNLRLDWAACLRPASAMALRRAMQLSWPLLAGILIGQWSVIVINRALSELPPGTLAEFGYAWKLLALVGLVPTGLATVIFPAFSEAHASGNAAEFSRLASRALRMTLLLTVPLAAMLIVERLPVISLIFGRGGMNAQHLKETASLFGILLLSAPASALLVTLNKLAFAMHDSKSSAAVSALSAVALTLLAGPIAKASGAIGVMWVLSLVSLGGTLLLAAFLILRYRIVSGVELVRFLFVLGVLCAGVALAVMAVHALFAQYAVGSAVFAALELVLVGVVAIACSQVLSRLLGIAETGELWIYAKWQFRQLPLFGKSRSSV